MLSECSGILRWAAPSELPTITRSVCFAYFIFRCGQHCLLAISALLYGGESTLINIQWALMVQPACSLHSITVDYQIMMPKQRILTGVCMLQVAAIRAAAERPDRVLSPDARVMAVLADGSSTLHLCISGTMHPPSLHGAVYQAHAPGHGPLILKLGPCPSDEASAAALCISAATAHQVTPYYPAFILAETLFRTQAHQNTCGIIPAGVWLRGCVQLVQSE